jgi:hypothetical protein
MTSSRFQTTKLAILSPSPSSLSPSPPLRYPGWNLRQLSHANLRISTALSRPDLPPPWRPSSSKHSCKIRNPPRPPRSRQLILKSVRALRETRRHPLKRPPLQSLALLPIRPKFSYLRARMQGPWLVSVALPSSPTESCRTALLWGVSRLTHKGIINCYFIKEIKVPQT